MKRVLLIILLFPLWVSAQKDSITTFRIGECRPVLAGKYSTGPDTVTPTQFFDDLKAKPLLTLVGCGDSAKVISFRLNYVYNGAATTQRILGNGYFSPELINKMQVTLSGFVTVSQIEYVLYGKEYSLKKRIVLIIMGS